MRAITMYLIDGVRVPRQTFERRQIWGKYVGAKFEVITRAGQSEKRS